MKQLKRLSLSGLAKEAIVLSVREQMNIYAGTGIRIDGLCYFEALDILSTKFNCGEDINDYMRTYGDAHGGAQSLMEFDEQNGWTGKLKGVDTNNATSYLTTQFKAVSVSLMGYDLELENNRWILTDMKMSNGVSHAVVVTGMKGGKYICRDSDKEYEVDISELGASFSMAVSGCRD